MNKQFILVLRGPSGSGKTNLAKMSQERYGSRIAHLRADYFYWKICPQDKDKHIDNNPLVYQNLADLAENYLEAGYSVIVEGLLTKIDGFGLWQKLVELSEQHDVKLVRVFLKVGFETAKKRDAQKDFVIEDERILSWIAECEKSITSQDIVIDTSSKKIEEVVGEVEDLL